MKIMDRVETLNYLNDKMNNNERIIVPRYNDGEYLLMNSTKKYIAKCYSEDILEQLKTISADDCLPHIIFYGNPGSGKKTTHTEK